MKRDVKGSVVCIIGLDYVGLPLAEAFSYWQNAAEYPGHSFRVNISIPSYAQCRPDMY